MKGNPLFRLIIILLAIGGVAWPVCKLTMQPATLPVMQGAPPSSSPSGHADPGTSGALRATMLLHAAPSPLHCSIMQGGRALLTESNLRSPGEYGVTTSIASDEDLIIAAEWENGLPHALQVQVMIPDRAPLVKNFWARSSLEDAFPVPGTVQP